MTEASQMLQPGEMFDVLFAPAVTGPLRFVAALSRVHTEMTVR